MPELIEAIVLGIVQGLTEFLPISSSGHLVLVPWLLGWESSGLLFDTMLHWGTLVAVFFVFWRDFLALLAGWFRSLRSRSLADPDARLAWYILIGTVPAVVLGLLLDDFFEGLFLNPRAVGFFMLVTAALLAGSEQLLRRRAQTRTLDQMTWSDAVIIGFAQALALAPGISRSGSTIAAGLSRGVRRDLAARFSFLLGTPAILGAGLLQLVRVVQVDTNQLSNGALPLIAGFSAAAITGVLAIRFLLRYLRDHTLYIFSVYCLVVGLLVLTLSFLR